ncbi:MAG TPA: TonB-dependent receptor [Rhizomicrobium sp.]|nr:TonB-dependent receptor [Rhizomicrobium sp.]
MSGIYGRDHARPVLLTALLATTALTGASAAYGQAIETVVVTAEKRAEDMQKAPLSIQVFNTAKLEQLDVKSFADYAAYMPSVSFSANASGGGLSGPGSLNVYMRGVASGNDGNHSGSLPSVGIYLDEQPVTLIGGAPDVHVYDLASIEALPGPQGTLYGASSEAGTLRIITNKPDLEGFSAGYDVEINSVEKGGIGGTVEGYVNYPISDNMAIRLVAWEEHDAGYIDNVAGTDAAAGIVDGVRTFPTGNIKMSNAALRKKDYNDDDIYGGRAALKIALDDNWTATTTFQGQETKANGSFAYDPAVGDLEVVKFQPEYQNDTWWQAALTIQGKIANLDVTYAAAFLDRKEHTQLDYSDYSYFYDAYYGQYFTDNSGNLINPSQLIVGKDHFTKQSHELRFASPSDQRLSYVAGAFWEHEFHRIEQRYEVQDFADALSIPGWPNTLWLTQEDRNDEDWAIFGEASYKLTPALTLTLGGRYFETDNSLKGFFGFSQGFQDLSGFGSGMNKCFLPYPIIGNGPCTDLNKDTKQNGATRKVNLSWQIDDDHMVYATWSNGFRPGGVNRNADVTSLPYKPEYLDNIEVGWKTAWLDNSLQFNGAAFFEKWKDFQFSFLGPNSLTVIANAGRAQIKGVEASLIWRVTEDLSLNGNATYTDAHLSQPYCKDSANCAATTQAPNGQSLPITPQWKVSAQARYGFNIADFRAHLQAALNHQSSSFGDLRSNERSITGSQPEYTVVNLAAGLGRDSWTAELTLENAFDERAQLYRYSECTPSVCGPETYIIPNRPRTIALHFGQRF